MTVSTACGEFANADDVPPNIPAKEATIVTIFANEVRLRLNSCSSSSNFDNSADFILCLNFNNAGAMAD